MSVLNRLTLLEHMVDNLSVRLQAVENARLQAVEADRQLGAHTDGDRQHLYQTHQTQHGALYPVLVQPVPDAELTVSTDAELTCPPATSP